MYRINSYGSLYCTILILFLMGYKSFAVSRFLVPSQKEMLLKSEKVMCNEVGITELTNNNDGKEIRKYLNVFNLYEGSPYCAAGIYWCYLEAHKEYPYLSVPIIKSAVACEIFYFARKTGIESKYHPERHDLIVWKSSKSFRGHIERIIRVEKAGWVKTVGFNTSKIINNKRKEGVFIHRRNIYHPLMRLKILGLIGFNRKNS